ncbi:MAG: hypothetical protein FK734_11085, partial [Asgard group archaeon]|nr:hypothetical protein [Asgard group archaeon]
MKISKKWQNLFLAVVVLGLLGMNTILFANSNIKAAPPATGLWVISDQQIIDNEDIIINGSINILATGELQIVDSTIAIYSNETFNSNINVAGSLLIDNSTITVSNGFNYTITAQIGSTISIIDSDVNNFLFSSSGTDINIIDSFFSYYTQFDISDSTDVLITGSDFSLGDDIITVDDAGTLNLVDNSFEDKGIEVFDPANAAIEYNTFDIPVDENSLYVDDGNNVNISHNIFYFGDTALKVDYVDALIYNNSFGNSNVALELSHALRSVVTENIFDNVVDTCIFLDDSDLVDVINNQFNNSESAIYNYKSTITIDDNIFFNLANGIE